VTEGKTASLESSWLELLKLWDIRTDVAQEIFLSIADRYSSNGRYYHTLKHIQTMLAVLELQRDKMRDYPAAQLAAWFHDIVYDTHNNDNEEQSARFAEDLQDLGISQAVIHQVTELILSTKTHCAPDGDTDTQIFLDADLAILGSTEEEYRAYQEAIRKEYAWVPEETYRSARKGVLQEFLDRERIYFTKEIAKKLERQARSNLKRELETLD
jgi:predicted metal-dependent HD superfamily phosphohydrolase